MQQENNHNTNKLLLDLAERTNKAVFVYNVNARNFSYLNPAFEMMWGKTIESIKEAPESLIKIIHPDDLGTLEQSFQQLVKKTKKEDSIEFRIQIPPSLEKWISLTAHLVDNEPEELVISGFAEDISAMKENIGYLQKFAAKKNSVLEILAHDLAGPLRNIQGISSLIKEGVKEYNSPELNKMIEMISRTSERSIVLIHEFLKQEFLESAHTILVRKRVDIVQLIDEVIQQYKSAEKNIAKTFHLNSSSEKIFTEVDDYKFSQVINNLISNSIKFTRDGGVIKVGIEDKEEKVLITVADNGIGIPENRQEDLFEKFTRARRPGLKGEPSVGLGMSIIKTIVEWHNGKIWFESKENKGTTFFIELPKE